MFTTDVLLILRFVKLIGVALLATGTIGAFVPRALEDRRRFGYAIAGAGFGLTWSAGIATAFGAGVSLFASWIVGAALASLVSINVVLWAIGKEGRRSPSAGALAAALLALALALMVWKP